MASVPVLRNLCSAWAEKWLHVGRRDLLIDDQADFFYTNQDQVQIRPQQTHGQQLIQSPSQLFSCQDPAIGTLPSVLRCSSGDRWTILLLLQIDRETTIIHILVQSVTFFYQHELSLIQSTSYF
jgi:hypothetical protein